MEGKGYEKIKAWQKSMELVKSIYELTRTFPQSEIFSLTSQMQRASISIPSNISEGYRRGSEPEFNRFLKIAYGSGAELETQLKIAQMLGYGKEITYKIVTSLLDEVMRLLNTMIRNCKNNA